MLKIIEPQAHEFYNQKIDSLLSLFKIYQNFYLDPEAQDRATFVIAEDNKRGVYGGTVLYPRKISSVLKLMPEDTYDEALGKMFSSFHAEGKEYWTARICLCIGHDTSTPLIETVKLCQRFYRNLYKAFLYFGEKNGIETLTFTLRPAEAHVNNSLCLLTYQAWPYFLEVRPSDESGGYYNGILSLKGNALKIGTLKVSNFKTHSRKPSHSYPSSQVNFVVEDASSEEGRV
jgi:hypothetical protein